MENETGTHLRIDEAQQDMPRNSGHPEDGSNTSKKYNTLEELRESPPRKVVQTTRHHHRWVTETSTCSKFTLSVRNTPTDTEKQTHTHDGWGRLLRADYEPHAIDSKYVGRHGKAAEDSDSSTHKTTTKQQTTQQNTASCSAPYS